MISIEIYTSNIQGSGGSKIPELSARTADADFIILNETNTRAGHENSISLGAKCVSITDGGEAEKFIGFGTVVSAKRFNPETDSIIYSSRDREITTVHSEIASNVYSSIIGMYLSPNDSAVQVNLFFKQLDEQLH